jgi:hypothetical protein
MESLTESNVCDIEDASDERSEEGSDSSFENANEQADHYANATQGLIILMLSGS